MSTANSPLGFLGLLTCLLLLLALPGLFSGYSGGLISILLVPVLMASLYLVATEKKHLTVGLLLAVPALFTHWSFGLLSETIRLVLKTIKK